MTHCTIEKKAELKKYLQRKENFDINECIALFQELKTGMSYKAESKFLESIFFSSENDNLKKFIKKSSFLYHTSDIQQIIKKITEKLPNLKNKCKYQNKLTLAIDLLSSEKKYNYINYFNMIVLSKKTEDESLRTFYQTLVTNMTCFWKCNVDKFNDLDLALKKDILYSFIVIPEVKTCKILLESGVKPHPAYLEAAYTYSNSELPRVIELFKEYKCDFSTILFDRRVINKNFYGEENSIDITYNIKGFLLELSPKVFFSEINHLIPGDIHHSNLYSFDEKSANSIDTMDLCRKNLVFNVLEELYKNNDVPLFNNKTLFSETFNFLYLIRHTDYSLYRKGLEKIQQILNTKTVTVNANFTMDHIHVISFCLREKLYDIGISFLNHNFDPNINVNTLNDNKCYAFFDEDHVIFNKYVKNALPLFKEDVIKVFFDKVIEKKLNFENLDNFTYNSFFDFNIISLINKHIPQMADIAYSHFLISACFDKPFIQKLTQKINCIKEFKSPVDMINILEKSLYINKKHKNISKDNQKEFEKTVAVECSNLQRTILNNIIPLSTNIKNNKRL